MALFPDELRAVPGRPIPAAWRGLEKWVDDFPALLPRGSFRVYEFPGETLIAAASRRSGPLSFFTVRMAGTVAYVGPGLLNLEVPRMGDENLSLDGMDESGEDTSRRPSLECLSQAYGGPGPDRRSFVCLRVLCDPVTAEPLRETRPLEWLSVVHRPALPAGTHFGPVPGILEAGESANVGLWPLAVLYWDPDGKVIRRTLQATMHNLQHSLELAAEPDSSGSRGLGRHWFYGAT